MWMHGVGGIMMGYAMGGWGSDSGRYVAVYSGQWPDSGRYVGVCQGLGGYSLPRTPQNRPKSGVSGGSRVLPPGPGGSPPAPGAENCQNRRVFNNSPIRDRNCTLSSAKVRRGVPGGPPGGPIFGPPRTPRGAPPGPRPKSGKSRVSGGRPKSGVPGGPRIWWTAILGYARGVGIMMGYAMGVGTMMGDAMGV